MMHTEEEFQRLEEKLNETGENADWYLWMARENDNLYQQWQEWRKKQAQPPDQSATQSPEQLTVDKVNVEQVTVAVQPEELEEQANFPVLRPTHDGPQFVDVEDPQEVTTTKVRGYQPEERKIGTIPTNLSSRAMGMINRIDNRLNFHTKRLNNITERRARAEERLTDLLNREALAFNRAAADFSAIKQNFSTYVDQLSQRANNLSDYIESLNEEGVVAQLSVQLQSINSQIETLSEYIYYTNDLISQLVDQREEILAFISPVQ